MTIEYRWADGDLSRFPVLVAELVQLKVDVIVLSGPPAVRAAQRATYTIPIVFVLLSDPAVGGYVASLARPGGNMTGLASQYEELITKQLQLLQEALPKVSRVAILHQRESSTAILSAAETAARSLALTARTLKVSEVNEFEGVFKTARSERVGAIHVLPSPIFNAHRKRLIELAARYRLPAVYEFRNYVEDGGLMSYGPSIVEMFRGMASYVDRILKGAKPGDLPIERPTTFELAINLKTARPHDPAVPVGASRPDHRIARARESRAGARRDVRLDSPSAIPNRGAHAAYRVCYNSCSFVPRSLIRRGVMAIDIKDIEARIQLALMFISLVNNSDSFWSRPARKTGQPLEVFLNLVRSRVTCGLSG